MITIPPSVSRLFAFALLLGSSAVLSACITLSSRSVDTRDASAVAPSTALSLREQVDALARPLVQDHTTPGIVVGVYSPALGMHFYGYGRYDKALPTAPDADTVFAVGSVTKLFVDAVLSRFVQQGKLHWDDRLGDLLPGVKLSPDAANMTLVELASHTSGLPRQPVTPQVFGYFLRYLFTGKNFYQEFDRKYLFNYLASFKAPSEPHKYRYSNIGHALIGYVLEQKSGQPLKTLLQQDLYQPLGLQHTALSLADLPPGLQLARGYAGDEPAFIRRGDPVPDWHFTPIMRATGSLRTTAGDLLKFAVAHFNQQHTKLGAALAATLQTRAIISNDEAVAIGWQQDRILGQTISYKTGFVAGYSSYVGLDSLHHNAVVVLQNSFNWEDQVGQRLLIRLRNASKAKYGS